MKKIFCAAVFSLTLVMICGCVHKTEKADNSPVSVADQTESGSAAVSDATNIPVATADPDSAAQPASGGNQISGTLSGGHISDLAGILNENDIQQCEDEISRLHSEKMLNVAVVTVSSLEGSSPQEYAAQCYTQIFGEDKSHGILFLINNDTGEDVLYKSGAVVIDADAEKQALYQATEDIVNGSIGSGALRMLKLGDTLPSHVFDNSGSFTSAQISALESAAAAYGSEVSLYTLAHGEEYSPETASALCSRRYPDNNGVMLFVDINGNTTAYPEEKSPADLKNAAPSAPVEGGDQLYDYLSDLLTKGGTS